MKRLIGFFLLSVSSYLSHSQCSQILNRAEDSYDAGKLLSILKEDPNAFDFIECLDHKGDGALSKEERIRAKKLLTKVYIFTDNEAEAEIALIGLLKEDPEHILDPQVDPEELRYLMKQFRTDPIFRVGIRVGANLCTPYIIGEYSTSSIPKFYNGKTADGKTVYQDALGDFESQEGASIGILVDAIVERKIYKGLDGSLGVQYRSSTYNVESLINSKSKTTLSNSQRYWRIPLGMRYTLWNSDRSKNTLPYVFVGASLDYLSSAFYESSRSGGSTYTVTKSDGNIVSAGTANRFNYSYFGGIGAKFRLKTHFITFDLRYDMSQLNYTDSGDRYLGNSKGKDLGNKSMLFDSAFTEDNVSLNYLSATFGFTYSVHKPRKLKNYR